MREIVLNFSAPIMSWGSEAVTKNRVDTRSHPELRTIQGLIAACYGIPRGKELPTAVKNIVFEYEIIRKGQVITDFQTISEREDEEFYRKKIGLILSEGKTSKIPKYITPNGKDIIHRTYLADQKSLLFLRSADDSQTLEIFEKLEKPVWSPYLGKKAFPPTAPFILGVIDNSERSLIINKFKESVLRDGK